MIYEYDNHQYEYATYFTLFIAGFIIDSDLFVFFGWILPFAKWIWPFFYEICAFHHESATFIRKISRLPLLDISNLRQKCTFCPYSLAAVAYSWIFPGSAITLNESASVENESATQFVRFPHFSLQIHLFLWRIHFFSWRIHLPFWRTHHFRRVRHDIYMNLPWQKTNPAQNSRVHLIFCAWFIFL